jgi:phospholipid N-methyltransferase
MLLQRSALWLFVREIIFAPTISVGAIWPSSGRLAKHLAAQVPLPSKGLILELGAGTGVVTQALIERGVNPERLVVVERHPPYVQFLRAHFP